jgi:hypothetical protein
MNIPKTLKELNENYLQNMDIYLSENWDNVPVGFIESISELVDSLLLGKSMIRGYEALPLLVSNITDLSELKDDSSKEAVLQTLKVYNFQDAVKKQIEELSILKDASFYDSACKELFIYLKKYKEEDLLLIKAKPEQVVEFEGFNPTGGFLDFKGLMCNNHVNYRYENQYEEHYRQLAKLVISYKVAAYTEIQNNNLKNINPESLKDKTVDEIIIVVKENII